MHWAAYEKNHLPIVLAERENYLKMKKRMERRPKKKVEPTPGIGCRVSLKLEEALKIECKYSPFYGTRPNFLWEKVSQESMMRPNGSS